MCLAWGSTFLALKVGLAHLPPFLLAGVRFVVAGGLLLYGLLLRRGRLGLSRRDIGRLLPLAMLMITLNSGSMAWGTRLVPTGAAAVVNYVPVSLGALTLGVLYGQERFTVAKGVGVGLGVLGVLLLFSPASMDAPQGWAVAVMCLTALGYAWGAVLSRPLVQPSPPWRSRRCRCWRVAWGCCWSVRGPSTGVWRRSRPCSSPRLWEASCPW